jgi:hypothetical protein
LPLCTCWLSAYVGGFNRVAILLDHLSSRPNSRRNFRCIWQLFHAGRSTPQADIRKINCLPLVRRTLYSWSQAIEVPEPPEICALPSFPYTPPIMALWLLQPRLSPHHVRYVMSSMPSTRWGKMRSSYSGSKKAPALRLPKHFSSSSPTP